MLGFLTYQRAAGAGAVLLFAVGDRASDLGASLLVTTAVRAIAAVTRRGFKLVTATGAGFDDLHLGSLKFHPIDRRGPCVGFDGQ
jgi:hypothetical protein